MNGTIFPAADAIIGGGLLLPAVSMTGGVTMYTGPTVRHGSWYGTVPLTSILYSRCLDRLINTSVPDLWLWVVVVFTKLKVRSLWRPLPGYTAIGYGYLSVSVAVSIVCVVWLLFGRRVAAPGLWVVRHHHHVDVVVRSRPPSPGRRPPQAVQRHERDAPPPAAKSELSWRVEYEPIQSCTV